MRGLLLAVGCLLLLAGPVALGEVRTWRAPGRFTFRAEFVRYDGGTVYLRRHNGDMVEVRLEHLSARDREEVTRLAGEDARGSLPAGQMERPSGRRDLTWRNLHLGDHWPREMSVRERRALEGVSRSWNHAESEFALLHYQQIGYARQVARQADFFYQFIAADLQGVADRREGKSHIVLLRNERQWKEFVKGAGVVPEWSSAYVNGHVMYVQDTGRGRDNAHMLAHEMSHLVLNRFFARQPPLWLNEGLAEWYGSIAWKAYNGQRVDPSQELGRLRSPMPLGALMSARGYPEDPGEVARFYRTGHHLVGFLMLEGDHADFSRFLELVTVRGRPVMAALGEVYGYESVEELEESFHAFLR